MARFASNKQVFVVARATGIDKSVIRSLFPHSEKISPVIDAITRGDATGTAVYFPAEYWDQIIKHMAARPVAAEAEEPAAPAPAPAEIEEAAPAEEEPVPAVIVPSVAPDDFRATLAHEVGEYLRGLRSRLEEQAFMLNDSLRGELLRSVDTCGDYITDVIMDVRLPAAAPAAPALPPVPANGSADYVRPAVFDKVYTLARAGFDILLVGPAGCGKSRLACEVAKALELDSAVFAFRAGMSSSQILYSKNIINGDTSFTLAPFLESCQREQVTVIDEVFSVDAEVLIGLNGLLESGQRSIDTPLGTVARPAGHRIIATSNGNGRSVDRRYSAPQMQDQSTLSRFVIVPVDYDNDVENAIARSSGAPEWSSIAEVVHAARECGRRNNWSFDVSTRFLIQACRLNAAGFDVSDAVETALMSRLSETEREQFGRHSAGLLSGMHAAA